MNKKTEKSLEIFKNISNFAHVQWNEGLVRVPHFILNRYI